VSYRPQSTLSRDVMMCIALQDLEREALLLYDYYTASSDCTTSALVPATTDSLLPQLTCCKQLAEQRHAAAIQAAAVLATSIKQQGIPETGRIALAGFANGSEPLILKTSSSASTLKCRPKTARGKQQLKPVVHSSTITYDCGNANGCITVGNGNNLKKKLRPASAPPKRSNGVLFNTYGGSSSSQMLLLQQHACANDADSTDNTVATPKADGHSDTEHHNQQQHEPQYCCASGELANAIQHEAAYVDMQADPWQLQQSEVVQLVTRLRAQVRERTDTSVSLQADHPTVGYIQALEQERQQARITARQQAGRYNELKLAYAALQRHQTRPITATTSSYSGKVKCKSSIGCAKLLSHSQSLNTLRSLLRA
jgi:hypothetical protein